MINFGSHAVAEVSGGPTSYQWTEDQLYTVSWGHDRALVAPQIYCSGQVPQWASFARQRKLYIHSVTSTNGLFDACTAYLAEPSWHASMTS